jgi:hypothetical protein
MRLRLELLFWRRINGKSSFCRTALKAAGLTNLAERQGVEPSYRRSADLEARAVELALAKLQV